MWSVRYVHLCGWLAVVQENLTNQWEEKEREHVFVGL
jgi:hypothetical protein